ncbi:MAG: methyltransferase domain-containing protein [Pseudomonadota bacterium]|nr:methyltransferase domain-containing protein [Pseudomonadota bacterium]
MREIIYPIDVIAANKRRQRASPTYHAAAVVQREITDRLLERLDYMLIQPQAILELGEGLATEALQNRFPNATVVTKNIVEIFDASTHALRLPCENASQQLIVANLVLHWCVDPKQVLTEIRRVLRADGVLLFSTMGPDSLRELRQAFAEVDNQHHVHEFLDMHDLGDVLQELGYVDPVVDMHTLRVKYPDVIDLCRDLQHLGASNVHLDRHRGLFGKKKWQRVLQAYRAQNNEGNVYASYELVFGLAWGIRQLSRDGEVSIPLSSLFNKVDE